VLPWRVQYWIIIERVVQGTRLHRVCERFNLRLIRGLYVHDHWTRRPHPCLGADPGVEMRAVKHYCGPAEALPFHSGCRDRDQKHRKHTAGQNSINCIWYSHIYLADCSAQLSSRLIVFLLTAKKSNLALLPSPFTSRAYYLHPKEV